MNGEFIYDTEDIIKEMQMLANLSSRNITLLYYNIVKGGSYFNKNESLTLNEDLIVEDFDDWFNNHEDI